MMRTVQFEFLRPEEILEAQAKLSLAYLPIGPLEWHGPHLPYGTDALNAHAIACGAAEQLGGVVFPTLFCGTEAARSPETLRHMGFEDESLYLVGMDVPGNPLSSCYFPEESFGMILRENIRQILRLGFETLIIVNGHGADGQLSAGKRIAREMSVESGKRVLFCFVLCKLDEQDEHIGHANISETSMQLYLNPEAVRLEALPQRSTKLYTYQSGIADGLLFAGLGNPEFSVEHDPRDAYPELGRAYIERGVREVVSLVQSIKQ